MFKRLICTLILSVLLIFPLSVSALNEVSFYLTDVSCEQNRLFETTLCVSGEVAAFTATLTYDENDVTFRGAKAINSEAELSVNSTEGLVKIAYLCENGASGELITFTFKSTDKGSSVSLAAQQVIDCDLNDLTVTSLKGAEVSVASVNRTESEQKTKAEAETTAKTENTEVPTANSAKSTAAQKELPAKSGYDPTLTFCIAGGAVLVFAVAALSFFLGKNSAKNNNNRKT